MSGPITPRGIRSGDPATLAALCEARGAAISAYCHQIAGAAGARVATADAFAQFRRLAIAPGSLTDSSQAERLLRRVTRHAAVSHAPVAPGDERQSAFAGCDAPEADLLGFVARELGAAERSALKAHAQSCTACAGALQRLHAAESAFDVAPGTAVPTDLGRDILTALVDAAPVTAHDGNATAVREEALRLLLGDEATMRRDEEAGAAREEETPAAGVASTQAAEAPEFDGGSESDDESRIEPEPEVEHVERTRPVADRTDRTDRLRAQLRTLPRPRWPPPDHPSTMRAQMLLRGALRLMAVVLVAGLGGALLGIGIAALTDDDDASAPLQSSGTSPATGATPRAAVAKLPVRVLSATAQPGSGGAAGGSRLDVRVRVENRTGRSLSPKPPELSVDGVRVAPEPTSTRVLLAPSLDAGASEVGTLRFEVPSATPSELTAARVRLKIVGKFAVVRPVIGNPAAGNG